MADNIHANMPCYPLYYDTISLKITQVFHLLLDFAENQGVFLGFKIQNSIRITEGSDNRGSNVYVKYSTRHMAKMLMKYKVKLSALLTSSYQ